MKPRDKEWIVYCLYSTVHPERTYVGISCDHARRLRQHNGQLVGGARATRAHRPWAPLFHVRGNFTHKQAAQWEYALKRKRRGGGGQKGRVQTLQHVMQLGCVTKKAAPTCYDQLRIWTTMDETAWVSHQSARWPLLQSMVGTCTFEAAPYITNAVTNTMSE